MGDEKFRLCLQTFFEKYKYDNVLTEAFLQVVDSVSGKEYEDFFRQWLHTAGHPVLSVEWKQKRRKLELTFRQHQEQHVFRFPMDIKILGKKGQSLLEQVEINSRDQQLILELPFKAKEVIIDPDTWLLYEDFQGS
jgi:aminopeptidase N